MPKKFHPDFKPSLTPKQMLALGVFGGAYFQKDKKEYPASWFQNAKLSETGKPDKSLNYYNVNASQSLAVWKKKGWIRAQDPRGWFQWYCRYSLGRRSPDDERQIKRWKAIMRHAAAIKKNCKPRDQSCRPRQRQALLHWAVDARKI